MVTITLKNVPNELYEELKAQARANRRSINNEIIICIENNLHRELYDPKAILAAARLLREKTARYAISNEELSKIKSHGRL